MQINKNTKMSEVIHMNYLLLPVINRFGIYLGFGDKTVEEICNEKKVNTEFFLDIVNAYHNESYFPVDDLQTFSIKSIVNYLRKAHANYLSESVPQIEELITRLLNDSEQQKKNLELVKNFFNEYKKEITEHINREETAVYPYAVQVENAFEKNKIDRKLVEQMQQYSMQDYMNEHDDIEEKLFDLKNIIIKYLPPTKQPELCNNILTKLFNLERDLNDHSRIEEKVMVPKVILMEKEIIRRYKLTEKG